jgi:hypothetical protein
VVLAGRDGYPDARSLRVEIGAIQGVFDSGHAVLIADVWGKRHTLVEGLELVEARWVAGAVGRAVEAAREGEASRDSTPS